MCKLSALSSWAHRVFVETARSPKTWFWTATFGPSWRATFCPSPSDFQASVSQALTSASECFRSLRQSCSISYLLVVERHPTTGYPHLHALVHGSSDLTWRVLCEKRSPKGALIRRWPHGHTHATLVSAESPRVASYLLKYLWKDNSTPRLRASTRYGKIKPDPRLTLNLQTEFSEVMWGARGDVVDRRVDTTAWHDRTVVHVPPSQVHVENQARLPLRFSPRQPGEPGYGLWREFNVDTS